VLKEKLKDRNIILGSGSPRRKYFLEELALDFEIRLKPVQETYPPELIGPEISDFLAVLKAQPFVSELTDNDILITADTIVWCSDHALGKPGDEAEAVKMLKELSCQEHEVISSVALTTTSSQRVINESTRVKFKCLRDEEIEYYVRRCKPLDKAGSYGIQEWIGLIGIEWIQGSYFNVMGFPVQKFYEKIREM
jgi:septum formation protein